MKVMSAPVRVETPEEVLQFRKLFPIFRKKVHLCSNSKGALSDTVMRAHQEYLDSWNNDGAPWHTWVGKHEELRAAFASLIGARPHEIAVCPSVSVALGSVASCINWRERPGLVFDDYSFPSVTYLWHAQSMRGAEIRRVHPDEKLEISPPAFDTVLDENCRLVSVAHVCYKNGHRLDLRSVAQKAHEIGAWFVVDDYQSSGSRPLNVRELGIDILTTGTVKFMLGSAGVALLYVREELLPELHPTLTGWFGQKNPDDFQIERHDEAIDSTRFQNGTPAIPAIYDSLVGIELIKTVGLGKIGHWIDTLTALLIARLHEEGFVPATPIDPAKRGPQVAIRTTDMDAAVAELARRNICVTSRDGNIRIAFHYYNTTEDIEVLIANLKEMSRLMLHR
ncbi:MAG: aminotransferase class V-fold PLP-dependent enzyme [Acidobacteria bacterium]|nr:aminotransferase class V-fold PLP-dependent enzyme [Acidobacteriota bacterium]